MSREIRSVVELRFAYLERRALIERPPHVRCECLDAWGSLEGEQPAHSFESPEEIVRVLKWGRGTFAGSGDYWGCRALVQTPLKVVDIVEEAPFCFRKPPKAAQEYWIALNLVDVVSSRSKSGGDFFACQRKAQVVKRVDEPFGYCNDDLEGENSQNAVA